MDIERKHKTSMMIKREEEREGGGRGSSSGDETDSPVYSQTHLVKCRKLDSTR